ncbi:MULTISPECIES: hypothetical protein [Vitreoscilla]|uniref:J domain-containing protein n=1 Tax=Vitreoscilla stercoraria TaxID=61 RepID=A0ABY4E883_VITST|nr:MULTISPECIES: hypothetical protein [Vitreoscilla]AUZ04291.1 hypothetical protein ADP71_05070 [Vitreoscilla sp. C1]UOO91966.1 hypothetical protein LVJ81_10035 [Vitreoscilla stercoraria]
MLNLYAVLNVSSTASDAELKQAIDAAESSQQLPDAVVQSARFYLLNTNLRQAYDHSLKQALQKGTLTTDWKTELSKQKTLPMTHTQALAQHHQATTSAHTHTYTPARSPERPKPRMGAWHWLLLLGCLLVTGVLVIALWQMAQVQMRQDQKILLQQHLSEQQVPPENWNTWLQKEGETYLPSSDASHAYLSIHKNATQDLPVLALPRAKNIDCGERGNQFCDVTFVFDGQAPYTYTAQIIGKNLVFKDMQQVPFLMRELSRSSYIKAVFPNSDDLPEMHFGRDLMPPENTKPARRR